MEYKIGQILVSNCDTEVEKALSGDKVLIPKGNKIIIGADGFAHHIRSGMIQPLQEGTIVKGYDTRGIAEYLHIVLRNHFGIDDMLDYDGSTKQDFINEIEYYLSDIGF